MKTLSKILDLITILLIEIGELSFFGWRFFKESFNRPFEFKEFIKQCFYMGNRSLLLPLITKNDYPYKTVFLYG